MTVGRRSCVAAVLSSIDIQASATVLAEEDDQQRRQQRVLSRLSCVGRIIQNDTNS